MAGGQCGQEACRSPQYQERMVNTRSDEENETGNAKASKCFFQRGVEGNLEQGKHSKPADNGKNLLFNGQVVLLRPVFEFSADLDTGDNPVAEVIDRNNSASEGYKVFNEMVDDCYQGCNRSRSTPASPNVIARESSYVPIPPGVSGTAFTRFPMTIARTITAKGICCWNIITTAYADEICQEAR